MRMLVSAQIERRECCRKELNEMIERKEVPEWAKQAEQEFNMLLRYRGYDLHSVRLGELAEIIAKHAPRYSNESVERLIAKCDEFRDNVLNQRCHFEAPCLDSDQTNAVLDGFDETIGKSLEAIRKERG